MSNGIKPLNAVILGGVGVVSTILLLWLDRSLSIV